MSSSSSCPPLDGVRYDRRILRAAGAVAAQPCHDRSAAIDLQRVIPIVAAATDGKDPTRVERRTIKRVLDTYTFSAEAEAELVELLHTGSDAEDDASDDEDWPYYIGREPDPPFFQCRIS